MGRGRAADGTTETGGDRMGGVAPRARAHGGESAGERGSGAVELLPVEEKRE